MMLKINKAVLQLTIFLLIYNCLAQNQNNQWNFGYNCTINFNSVPPTSVVGNPMQTLEGSASIADKTTGALLFYSDGLTVWNANNIPMPNGLGLLGGNTPAVNSANPFSSTSAVVIVPRPFTPDIYYVITIDQEDSTNGICYSVVDMTLNGGLGDIIAGQKNIPLYTTNSEKLQVVPNASGCGYWLLTMNATGNAFVAFSITQTGISTTPVISNVSTTQTNGRGHFKVNPQFTKIAMGNSGFFENRIELYDFNATTGIVSNPVLWNYGFPFSGLNFYGVEFSPDGTKLYVSNFTRIVQYDLSLATPVLIAASEFNITAAFPSLTLPGTLQLGPDNKIYVASSPLSAINAPNSLGVACNFQLNPIGGFVGTTKYGLPQKVFTLDVSETNTIQFSGTCQVNPTQFSLQNTANVVSATWNFGDPSSGVNDVATGLTPQHLFTSPGTFTVSVSIVYPCLTLVVTQSITIDSATVPTFDPIPPICSGAVSPILPTLSTNGVSGTWSPLTISNTIGATYVFTPVNGQCATTQSIITSVTNCTNTILFDTVCQNNSVTFSLQDTTDVVSVNWNFGDPTTGVNNLGSGLTPQHFYVTAGNYTVTAVVTTTSGSYTITQLITIQPSIALQFSFPILYLTGQTIPPLPTTSDNGIAGTWSPSAVDNLNSGSYTFTPTNPGCYLDNEVFIFINNFITPTFNPIPIICAGVAPPLLPTTSINGITGSWSPSVINNTVSGSYTFTPDPGQSASVETIFITVTNDLPSVVLTSVAATSNQTVCINEFIVPIIYNLGGPATGTSISGLPSGVFGSISGNVLTISGFPLENLNSPYNFTITTTGGNCGFATISGVINVNTLQIPIFNPIPPICSGSVAPILPTTSINGITGSWLPTIVSTTVGGTYTFTPDLLPCVSTTSVQITTTITTAIAPVFNPIPPICSGSVPPILPTTSINGITGSWSPAIVSNSIGGTYTFTPDAGPCVNTTPVQIATIVTASITPLFNPIPSICQGSLPPTLPTSSTNGIIGTWSPAIVSNTVSGSYIFTPNAGQCATSQTLNITVDPLITTLFATIAPICFGSTPPVLPLTSTNGIIGSWSPAIVSSTANGSYTFTPNAGQCATVQTLNVTVTSLITPSFSLVSTVCFGASPPTLPTISTNGILGSWSPAIINTTTDGTYTFTPNSGQCASTQFISITVTPIVTPIFNTIAPICSGTTSPLLPTASNNGVLGSWSPAIVSNTSSGTYTFTPNIGQCALSTTVTISVIPSITPTFATILPFCAGSSAPVLLSTSINGITGTWSPAIVDTVASGVYNFTPDAGQCASITTLSITVLQQQVPNFTNLTLCENDTFTLSNQSPNGILGTWSPATIDFTTSASYTFTPNSGQCAQTQNITVTINQDLLNSFEWIVSEPFSDISTVTILTNTPGFFLYQLDAGPLQTSNVFENVSSGLHTVQVIDPNGCSATLVQNDILIIKYPLYFTPNGDGFNETWNITDLFLQRNSQIFIFDRFGKLLKQIFPYGPGWDGRYNNNEMLSDDYWFTVDYDYNNERRQFKAHFSLKR